MFLPTQHGRADTWRAATCEGFLVSRAAGSGYSCAMALNDVRYLPCPCCGFPSITTMIAMTCSICWWEADGAIVSDDARSSTNHGYSIRRARENFRRHGHMYDSGREISYLTTPSEARRALMEYVRRVLAGETALSQQALCGLIAAEDDHMRSTTRATSDPDADEEAMLRALMTAAPRRT